MPKHSYIKKPLIQAVLTKFGAAFLFIGIDLYFTGEEIIIKPEDNNLIDKELTIQETMSKPFCRFLDMINKFDGGHLCTFTRKKKGI